MVRLPQLIFHHTRLPPTSRQVPLTHCQRPFGLKTTTRGCHTTSHPAGHSIRRHSERSGLQCGIRTHIIPRPKRGAITKLGEPEKYLGCGAWI